jgi:hypothetical protein
MNCTCPICRKGVRVTVEQVFEAERQWLGPIGIRILGRMDWCDPSFLRSVLAEMADLGILIVMKDRPLQQLHPIPIYLLARLTVPVELRKRGVQ